MPEAPRTPYSSLLRSILRNAYAQHPWTADGEVVPLDIAMDDAGCLPVWWNQIEQSAVLLDIPKAHLPAERVQTDSRHTLTGWKLVWKDDIDSPKLSPTQDYLFRALLPALAMDALKILHQQEDILAPLHHLGMFPDQHALTNNLTEGLSVSNLINPCPEDRAPENTLPNEAAAESPAQPESRPFSPLPGESRSVH